MPTSDVYDTSKYFIPFVVFQRMLTFMSINNIINSQKSFIKASLWILIEGLKNAWTHKELQRPNKGGIVLLQINCVP